MACRDCYDKALNVGAMVHGDQAVYLGPTRKAVRRS